MRILLRARWIILSILRALFRKSRAHTQYLRTLECFPLLTHPLGGACPVGNQAAHPEEGHATPDNSVLPGCCQGFVEADSHSQAVRSARVFCPGSCPQHGPFESSSGNRSLDETRDKRYTSAHIARFPSASGQAGDISLCVAFMRRQHETLVR